MCVAATPQTRQITVAWDPSTSPGVWSYFVYQGTKAPYNFTNVTWTGDEFLTLDIPLRVTNYLAVTSFNYAKLESDYSKCLRILPDMDWVIVISNPDEISDFPTGPWLPFFEANPVMVTNSASSTLGQKFYRGGPNCSIHWVGYLR